MTDYGRDDDRIARSRSSGPLGDLILGHDSLSEYVEQCAYLGAVVGRYANRISGGRFVLYGRTYAEPTAP